VTARDFPITSSRHRRGTRHDGSDDRQAGCLFAEAASSGQSSIAPEQSGDEEAGSAER